MERRICREDLVRFVTKLKHIAQNACCEDLEATVDGSRGLRIPTYPACATPAPSPSSSLSHEEAKSPFRHTSVRTIQGMQSNVGGRELLGSMSWTKNRIPRDMQEGEWGQEVGLLGRQLT